MFQIIDYLRHHLYSLSAVLLIAVTATPAVADEHRPRQPYDWNPRSLALSIGPGQTETVELQLQANTALNHVTLRLSNRNVARYVNIAPSVLGNLKGGDIRTVRISFTMPPSGENARRLRNSIRVFSGRQRLAGALPFVVTLRRDDDVRGTDVDGNGIRDDIDQYIARTFPDPNARAAAIQFATALQSSLLDASNHDDSITHATELYRSVECMGSIAGDAGDDALDALKAVTLNNNARTRAYLAFNEQIVGAYIRGSVGSDLTSACVR